MKRALVIAAALAAALPAYAQQTVKIGIILPYSGQFADGVVGAGPDHDRIDVAGQHPRRVRRRLATGELKLVPAQDDRDGAELRDPDLEGDPGPRRGLLEDERDAPPGQLVGADPLPAAGL